MRDQFVTKCSKVEVMTNYWDKMIGQLQVKASKKGDNQVTKLVGQIILVPKEVRKVCLHHYVKQCRLLHSIAFMQWRALFPKTHIPYYNPNELKETTQGRINQHNNFENPTLITSNHTNKMAKI